MMMVAPSCCAYFGGLHDLILIESSLLVTDKASENVVRIGSKLSIPGGTSNGRHCKICSGLTLIFKVIFQQLTHSKLKNSCFISFLSSCSDE